MRVLIIKTGQTESFDTSSLHKNVISLGDVLRTTVILNLFKDAEVTWLTSLQAKPLLEGIPEIENLIHDSADKSAINFDLVVNLERGEKELELIRTYSNHKILGFVSPHEIRCGENISSLEDWLVTAKNLNWSQKLFKLLGKSWAGESYLISRKALRPSETNIFDVGFNWQVGEKWPSKSWPHSRWSTLENRIVSDCSVTWQKGFNDLNEYMNWINSCKILLSHDSLGLHISIALGKKTLGLFGPTASYEIPMKNGLALSVAERASFSCPPCYKDRCHNTIHCMEELNIDDVEHGIRFFLRGVDEQSEA